MAQFLVKKSEIFLFLRLNLYLTARIDFFFLAYSKFFVFLPRRKVERPSGKHVERKALY